MTAKPIIPGLLYQVTEKNLKAIIEAKNGAEAICEAIDILIILDGDYEN